MNKGNSGNGPATPNLGYPSDHPVNRFIRPQISYWDRFRIWVASVIHDLLTDKTIEAEGLNYLDRVFRHEQTHEAGVNLLTQVLNDKRFVDEGNLFGTALIAHVLARDSIQADFKDLIVKTLANPEVKDETLRLVEYILRHPESEEILAKYFNAVFGREDILENLTTLLTASACNAMADPKTKDIIQEFCLQFIENKTIKEGVFENYLYSPVRSFFSFGYQEAEQARLAEEKQAIEDYKNFVNDYFDKNKEKTMGELYKYPGYE